MVKTPLKIKQFFSTIVLFWKYYVLLLWNSMPTRYCPRELRGRNWTPSKCNESLHNLAEGQRISISTAMGTQNRVHGFRIRPLPFFLLGPPNSLMSGFFNLHINWGQFQRCYYYNVKVSRNFPICWLSNLM